MTVGNGVVATLVVVISPATAVGKGVVATLVVIISHPGGTTPPFSSAVGHILHATCGVVEQGHARKIPASVAPHWN